MTLEQEQDLEPVRVSIIMLVKGCLSLPSHVMMVHVRCGLVGPAGVNALQIVTVELSHVLVNVKMARRTNAKDHQHMNSNAIDSHVNLQ